MFKAKEMNKHCFPTKSHSTPVNTPTKQTSTKTTSRKPPSASKDKDVPEAKQVVAPQENSNPTLNKYSISCTLTESNKKQVLLATDTARNEPVILKLANSTTEYEMLMLLKHRHVAQVLEEFDNDGQHVIVMPKYMCYKDTFPRAASVQASVVAVTSRAIQLFNVISFLHEKGVYYGDISRHNVMFDSQGSAILMDFDLAGHINEIEGPSRFGTGIFVAPELDKKSHYDEKIDVYSCGILIIEWLRFALTQTKSNSVSECFAFFDSMKQGKYRDSLLVKLLAVLQGCVEQQESRLSSHEVVQITRLLFKNSTCGTCQNTLAVVQPLVEAC